MADPTIAVELLREYPHLLVAVAIVARVARAWQAQLTWTEYRMIHRFKRGVFPLAERIPTIDVPVLGRIGPDSWLLVSQKGGRDDAEYETTVRGSVREVVASLQDAGASLHLLNSLKRRPDTHGDPLSAAHVVWTIRETGDQVEGYAFDNDDGTVDLYAHTESSTDDPLRHLTGEQTDGDDYDVLPEIEPTA